MAKLYPPYIEGTIPAFYGTTLVVPFSMNRAVGITEPDGVHLKIKKINSNEVIANVSSSNCTFGDNSYASFDLSNISFRIGQFYRIQIAYTKDEEIGYYSTIGVVKYTALPSVSILGLEYLKNNLHLYNYEGKYEQKEDGDASEKLYSSRFILYDDKDKIIKDSGEIIHSVANDVIPSQAIEKFHIGQDLEIGTIYRLQLTIKTINGLVVKSPKYKIIQSQSSGVAFDDVKYLILNAKSNYEEGHIVITLDTSKKDQEVLIGSFLISRSEAKTPYEWEKIKYYFARSEKIKQIEIKDFTIEQGKRYVYSIQQYNNHGIYSNRIISNTVYSDFEDIFLLDGKRQLKIQFNPKISSMKDNILETKVNTIGSKYPFITRNGRVNHKEFSLSGLISYLSDNNSNFMNWKDLNLETRHTNLTSDNIYAERQFKLEVLSWLNNGNPKILKTPTEGNYIVRLMGVSMSPNDSVGRMLHSFNCTASEIAPFNYETLIKNEFVSLEENNNSMVTLWKTINFYDGENYLSGEVLSPIVANSIKITDMTPGSRIIVNGEEFYIGITGSYNIKTDIPITSVIIPEKEKSNGCMLVEYQGILETNFDEIKSIEINGIPLKQITGFSNIIEGKTVPLNLLDKITDVKTTLTEIIKVTFKKRQVHKVNERPKNNSNLMLLDLYEIVNQNEYYDPFHPKENLYIIDEPRENIYDIIIDDEKININEIEEITFKNINPKVLSIREGVVAELSYYSQTINYSFEDEDETIKSLKNEYLKNYNKLKNNEEGISLETVQKNYEEYINAIELYIKNKYEIGG